MEFERSRRGRQFIQLFFLLTYHLGQEERIRIAPPQSRSAEVSQTESPPSVAVTRDGDIYCLGRKTDLMSLRGVVSSLHRGGPPDIFRIRADREVPVGLLV